MRLSYQGKSEERWTSIKHHNKLREKKIRMWHQLIIIKSQSEPQIDLQVGHCRDIDLIGLNQSKSINKNDL